MSFNKAKKHILKLDLEELRIIKEMVEKLIELEIKSKVLKEKGSA